MEMLQGVWTQHLRPRAVVGYGVKFFLPSPPNYVTRSPGREAQKKGCENSPISPPLDPRLVTQIFTWSTLN